MMLGYDGLAPTHLVATSQELYCYILSCAVVLCKLHKAKCTTVDVADLWVEWGESEESMVLSIGGVMVATALTESTLV